MNGVPSFLHGLAQLLPAVTRYAAVCCSVGAAAALLAPWLGFDPQLAFPLGFLLPLWPLVWYFNSPRRLRAELDLWRQLREEGRITQADERRLRQITLTSVAARWYGRGEQFNQPPGGPADGEGAPVGPG